MTKIVEELHDIVLTCVKAQRYQRKISLNKEESDGFIDQQGLYKVEKIMEYIWQAFDYFNSIDSDQKKCLLLQDGDEVYYDFNEIPIPISLKDFISPKSVRFDPTTKTTKDLLVSHVEVKGKAKTQKIDASKYFECVKSFNGLMYGEYSEDAHVTKLEDCRTDESLATFILRATDGERCLKSEEGSPRFAISSDALTALVEGNYFTDTLSNNNQCLRKHFKLNLE